MDGKIILTLFRTVYDPKGNMVEAFADGLVGGPLLAELLEAQGAEETAVSYPMIEHIADALTEHAQELQAVIWPVGAAAERIAGAAAALAGGNLTVGTWNRRLDGERVLLFAVSGVTPLGLVAAAAQVRSMGAAEVHASGVDVTGAANVDTWASFAALEVGLLRADALVH
jgi:hypothetical protein